MKITSCKCFESSERKISVNAYLEDDCESYQIDTYFSGYGAGDTFNNFKYCPYCGKKIEVEDE